MWTNRKSSSKHRNYSEEPNGTCTKTKTFRIKQHRLEVWLILFSISFLFYLALSLYAYLDVWNSFKKLLLKMSQQTFWTLTSLKFKKKKAFSSRVCDHDIKMKGLRFLHSLAAVFAYGELAYEPVKKDNFNQKHCSHLQ